MSYIRWLVFPNETNMYVYFRIIFYLIIPYCNKFLHTQVFGKFHKTKEELFENSENQDAKKHKLELSKNQLIQQIQLRLYIYSYKWYYLRYIVYNVHCIVYSVYLHNVLLW